MNMNMNKCKIFKKTKSEEEILKSLGLSISSSSEDSLEFVTTTNRQPQIEQVDLYLTVDFEKFLENCEKSRINKPKISINRQFHYQVFKLIRIILDFIKNLKSITKIVNHI